MKTYINLYTKQGLWTAMPCSATVPAIRYYSATRPSHKAFSGVAAPIRQPLGNSTTMKQHLHLPHYHHRAIKPNSIPAVQVCDATGADRHPAAGVQIIYRVICLCLLLLCYAKGHSQVIDYATQKEKVYVHTNHVFFKHGETVFYKAYVVHAATTQPTQVSNSIHIDIINPAGNVINRSNYAITHGYAEGSFDFTEGLPGGIYKLRAYTNWMQNEKDSTWFVKELTLQQVIAPRLLMKLDFPEKGYGAGDTVRANFSMRSLTDAPIKGHDVQYTLSIGGKATSKGNFKTNTEGKATVVLVLPDTLTTNDGLLNITATYDGYTEAISRRVPIVLNNIDLQFMPEGGTMVGGLPANIAFKALNENGKAADIKGIIQDETGTTVAQFESYHFGMGSFTFTPLAGHTYKASITAPANIRKTYTLPRVAPYGIVMHATTDSNSINVQLRSTGAMEVYVTLSSRNTSYFSKAVRVTGSNSVSIPIQDAPMGIHVLTITNEGGLPLAERLIFLHRDKQLQVKITTDKKRYMPREKVNMDILTTDAQGQPVPANLSVSVVDDKLWTFADDKQDHIASWLLMSSELKGKVEEPQFYFKPEEAKALQGLNLVMLTHGYRYFEYNPFVQKNGQLQFMPDDVGSISGIVLDTKGKPVASEVLIVNQYGAGNVGKFSTNEDGIFYFRGLQSATNYTLIAKAHKSKQRVIIKVLHNGMDTYKAGTGMVATIVQDQDIRLLTVKKAAAAMPALQKEVQQLKQLDNFGDANLQEVVVIGYGSERKKELTGSVVRVDKLDMVGSFDQILQGRVSGVSVVSISGVPGSVANIIIRGAGSSLATAPPLYVLDGIIVTAEAFQSLNPNDFETVEVLKDAAGTALFGSRASNGVIVVNTKKGNYGSKFFDITGNYYYATQNVTAGGTPLTVARKFYSPLYTSTETTTRNDFRETIYWNSVVETGEDGKASFSFYNSDASTTFRTIVEGIDINGNVGRQEFTYAAQNAMSVDVKVPPYLTIGDTALLPVVIKNNTQEPLPISLHIRLPKQFWFDTTNNSFTVLPDSSYQTWIPVTALQAVKTDLQLYVVNPFHNERIVAGIAAGAKGFPFIYTAAGKDHATHNLVLPEMIPGTLKTHIEVYDKIEGQLLNGIESMLREPYGCFEQTSSTTYPNVYILKYLKTSGNSNPDIETKARKYIQAGYNRLIGFETSQHGFEWFGHTPPHEALTAYGLLEFTDMKEFIQVDEAMLQRTKKFLLGRRDNKGGFNIASGGYDKFASVPNKIANIYIVYALTQAGMGNEILMEYDSSITRSLKSKDVYQMSMMALAASNMKDTGNYNKLMNVLQTAYRQKELPVETSVVNSRGASLTIEAKSLYALALMRNSNADIATVALLINDIVNQKQYYGYGSTQATVLALQAVLEYGKLVNNSNRNKEVQFTINNQLVTNRNNVANLATGANTLKVQYAAIEGDKIPYNIEIAGQTLMPPTDTATEIQLQTHLVQHNAKVGETVRMTITATNRKNKLQPMVTAKIGIPAGLSMQPWQLKELTENKQVAYYEIFDNYLVLYWMGFAPNENKTIHLDLKADIPGTYRAKASNIYLYYMPEHKFWCQGEPMLIGH